MTLWQFILTACALSVLFFVWAGRRWFPWTIDVRSMTIVGVLTALGTVTAPFFWVPVGPAKAYPVQHALNVLSGVLLGPIPAAVIAMLVGFLRNLFGIGTVLAFPGGMIGAFLAGAMYRIFEREEMALVGEVIGTGIFGALLSVPIVRLLLGRESAIFYFIPPFITSSLVGALIAYFILKIVGDRLRQLT